MFCIVILFSTIGFCHVLLNCKKALFAQKVAEHLPQRSSFANLDSDKDFLRISALAPDIASEHSQVFPDFGRESYNRMTNTYTPLE